MKRVLIVDDDRATSAGMADVVEEWGYEPEVADTVKAGWNAINKMLPDVAIVDLKLPDGSGLDLLHRIKESFPDVSVIILTGHATVDSAVKALKVGAEDYVTKPVDLPRLQVILKTVEDKQMMKQEIIELRRQLQKMGALGHLVGSRRKRSKNAVSIPLGQPMEEVERIVIEETLNMTDGDRRKTAEILGISYKTLYNKTKKYKSAGGDDEDEE